MHPIHQQVHRNAEPIPVSPAADTSGTRSVGRPDSPQAAGQSLPPTVRRSMEAGFGEDFSRVRVHSDSAAAAQARQRGVLAFTSADQIVFAAGQYAPHSWRGASLLAHELAHVVQQRHPGSIGGSEQETEAWGAAREVTRGRAAEVRLGAAAGHAQHAEPDDPLDQIVNDAILPAEGHSPDPGESTAIGSAGERHQFGEAKAALEREGYTEIYFKDDFRGWVKKAFPNKNAAPEVVAVDRNRNRIMVEDFTAGPWSTAEMKAGDPRRLPQDWPSSPTRKPPSQKIAHLEKTIDYGRQLVRNLPPDLKDAGITVRDRYWKAGGVSRQIDITLPRATAPAGSGGVARPAEVEPPRATAPRPMPRTSAPATPEQTAAQSPSERAPRMPEVAPPRGGTPGAEPEVRAPRVPAEAGHASAGTGLAIFGLLLVLGTLIPDPTEQEQLQEALRNALNRAESQARLRQVEGELAQAKGFAYETISFTINYEVIQSPKPAAFPNSMRVTGIDIVRIGTSMSFVESSSKVDPVDKPANASPVYGGGWHWPAHRSVTTSVQTLTGEQVARRAGERISPADLRTVAMLRSDTEIRDWVAAHSKETIAEVATDMKIRLLNRLLDGWVSDEDMAAVRAICGSVSSPAESSPIRAAIEPRAIELGFGNRARLRVFLSRLP